MTRPRNGLEAADIYHQPMIVVSEQDILSGATLGGQAIIQGHLKDRKARQLNLIVALVIMTATATKVATAYGMITHFRFSYLILQSRCPIRKGEKEKYFECCWQTVKDFILLTHENGVEKGRGAP